MGFFKKHYRKSKIIKLCVFTPLIIAAGAAIVVADVQAKYYENNIDAFLTHSGSNESVTEQRSKGNELSQQIEREGAVLVKNDNGTLPLKRSTKKVNVFGHGSVDWYYTGSGSGAINTGNETDKPVNFLDALKEYGISYNTGLATFYNDYRAPLGGNNPSTLSTKTETVAQLCEPSLAEYSDGLLDSAKNYSDTAFVVIARKAGESEDLPKTQYKYDKPADSTRGYLESSTEEDELLAYVGQNFANVIVIVNSTNEMQLDFLDRIDGIDAALVAGVTGIKGAKGLPEVIYGDYAPSGHLTDTYPYDLKTNITYYHSGYEDVGIYTNPSSGAWPYAPGDGKNPVHGISGNVYYQDYVEGIYVGYKWYETAAAEGYWDTVDNQFGQGYEGVVQYPFGYGLSYTSFAWTLAEASVPAGSELTDASELTFKVNVTNTGNVTGKDVVELYLTAPYTPGGIEKTAVSLVGFAKTPTIEPGAVATVAVTVKASEFKSFDAYDANQNGFAGYELEAGDYQLKFMTDSHNLKAGMEDNLLTYKVASDIEITEDETTHSKVTTLFTGTDAVDGFSVDGVTADQNVNYISRNNLYALPTEGAFKRPWNSALEVSPTSTKNNTYSQEAASAWDNATGTDAFGNPIPTTAPAWGSGSVAPIYQNGITALGKQLASDYDDPQWDEVLDSLSWEDSINIINSDSLGRSAGFSSLGFGALRDADGPQQIGSLYGGVTGTGYPGATVLAQTWSPALAYAFGKSFGQDMDKTSADGVYGFATNIHRAAYTGRNFEYYSEDPVLSGLMVANASRGLAVNGKFGYIKHFVANDSEYMRVGLYTWVTEQALREVYLKPFEYAVKDGEASAIMTSFNRIGATWAGGSEAALQGVLRNEWGFKCRIITDYAESIYVMDQAQAFRAGSNYGMKMNYTTGSAASVPTQATASIRFQNRLRESNKEVIYSYLTPLLINANYNESADVDEYIVAVPTKKGWSWWRVVLIDVNVLGFGGLAYLLYLTLRPAPLKTAKKKKDGTQKA